MKRNSIILVVAIILLIISAIIYFSKSRGTIKKELRDFAVQDTSEVTKIFMADKANNTVIIERKGNIWMVNGKYEARKDAVNTLLKTMHRLDVKEPVAKSAKENVIKLLSSRSTKVEIYSEDKMLKTYYVGGPTQDQYGTYMLLEGSSEPFIMYIPGFNGYLSTRYFIDECLWRSPLVFNYRFDDIASIEVNIPLAPTQSFRVFNYGDNRFGLEATGQKKMIEIFDTIAVKEYIGYYKGISSQKILCDFNKDRLDSLKSVKPYYIITVENIMGQKKSVSAYKMLDPYTVDSTGTGDRPFDQNQLWAYVNGKDMTTVQYTIFDPLLAVLDDFLHN